MLDHNIILVFIMAGLGRRSHYRKHLTDSVLNDLPEPHENERIAKVLGTRGGNQFELVIDPQDGELDTTPQLAILPTKFRKLVWLKRNDYVICAVADDDDKGDEAGIRYMVTHILYKEQVKHLKDKGFWPNHDFFLDEKEMDNKAQSIDHQAFAEEHNSDCEEDDGVDGIIYDNIDDEYFSNMNRVAKMMVADSSEEDSD